MRKVLRAIILLAPAVLCAAWVQSCARPTEIGRRCAVPVYVPQRQLELGDAGSAPNVRYVEMGEYRLISCRGRVVLRLGSAEMPRRRV